MSYYTSLDNAGIAPVTITTARNRRLNQSLIFVGQDLTGAVFQSYVLAYQGATSGLATLTITVSNVDTGVTYQSLVDNNDELCKFTTAQIPDCKAATNTVDVSTVLITASAETIQAIAESNPIQGADTVLYWHMTNEATEYPLAAGYFKLTGA